MGIAFFFMTFWKLDLSIPLILGLCFVFSISIRFHNLTTCNPMPLCLNIHNIQHMYDWLHVGPCSITASCKYIYSSVSPLLFCLLSLAYIFMYRGNIAAVFLPECQSCRHAAIFTSQWTVWTKSTSCTSIHSSSSWTSSALYCTAIQD
jgi:hypothetical protein